MTSVEGWQADAARGGLQGLPGRATGAGQTIVPMRRHGSEDSRQRVRHRHRQSGPRSRAGRVICETYQVGMAELSANGSS